MAKLKHLDLKSYGAGFILSFAGIISISAASLSSSPILQNLIRSCIFPIGLILIVLCDMCLYTGCVATLPNTLSRGQYFKDLGTCVVGNYCGSFLAALCVYLSPVKPLIKDAVMKAAESKQVTSLRSCVVLFLMAFVCNFLICFGIQNANKLKSYLGKIIVLFICVFIFVFFGFEHSVANMGPLCFSLFVDCPDTPIINLYLSLLIVIIGNFFGGFCEKTLFKTINENNFIKD